MNLRFLIFFGVLSGSAWAQLTLPNFLGTWCPRDRSVAEYDVVDESHEIEALKVSALAQGDSWRIRLDYSGLDSHSIEETIGPRGLRNVLSGEPGLKLRPLSSFLWEGGGKPVEIEKVGKLRGAQPLTTEAGTFVCQSYVGGEGKEQFEAFVNKDVSPFGLVLYRAAGTEIRLRRYAAGN